MKTGGCFSAFLSGLRCPAEEEQAPEMLAFPRGCTVAGPEARAVAYYAALHKARLAWQRDDVRYVYTRSGQLNQASYEALFTYQNVRTFSLPPGSLSEEKCGFCGVAGRILYCPACKSFVCSGALVGNVYLMRCACGHYGALGEPYRGPVIGVVPRLSI